MSNDINRRDSKHDYSSRSLSSQTNKLDENSDPNLLSKTKESTQAQLVNNTNQSEKKKSEVLIDESFRPKTVFNDQPNVCKTDPKFTQSDYEQAVLLNSHFKKIQYIQEYFSPLLESVELNVKVVLIFPIEKHF